MDNQANCSALALVLSSKCMENQSCLDSKNIMEAPMMWAQSFHNICFNLQGAQELHRCLGLEIEKCCNRKRMICAVHRALDPSASSKSHCKALQALLACEAPPKPQVTRLGLNWLNLDVYGKSGAELAVSDKTLWIYVAKIRVTEVVQWKAI